MFSSILPGLVALGAVLGGVGGTAALVMGLLTRRETRRNLAAQADKATAEAQGEKADAARELTGTALVLLEPLREAVREARKEAAEARDESAAARRETAAVRQELSDMDAKARALMRALTEAQDENAELRQRNEHLEDQLARRRRDRG